jgi:hypothetical protein
MTHTQVVVSHTMLQPSDQAGVVLAEAVRQKLGGEKPDLLILFASPNYRFDELLSALERECQPGLLVGCSSAGEYSGCSTGNASASIMAIRSAEILFHAAIGHGLRENQAGAVAQIMPAFTGSEHPDYPHRCALVLTDALAGHAEELIHDITVRTRGTYQLVGGGAADDARFRETHVFYGEDAYADAIVVVEMLSKKPLGLGVKHGWEPHGNPWRITEGDGNCVVSLNAIPAGDVFEEHADRTGQTFDRANPLPFFLHNVIGIDTGDGYKLRVPLSLNGDGSISFAAEIPVGAVVKIMMASVESACDAARQASQAAIDGLKGGRHAGSLLFDCAATRLRLGHAFSDELRAVAETLGSENFAGCNTYGQVARADGQFSGFHNCTAVVLAIPE